MIAIATQYSGNHKRIRHFMSKVNFLIQKVEDSMVNLVHLAGVDMPADILTKPLVTATHQQHTTRMLEGSYPLQNTASYTSSTLLYEPTMPLKSSLKYTTQIQSNSSPIHNVNITIPWPQIIFTPYVKQTLKWQNKLIFTTYFYNHDTPNTIRIYKNYQCQHQQHNNKK